MDPVETTDVIIVGCGPTGATLSTLLGQYGVKNIVLEREPEITTDPRGIALDEDGIRCLQACGIYDKIFTDIGQCTGSLKFISGKQTNLYKEEFLRFNYATVSAQANGVAQESPLS
jgi:2-polyprenyl-6-methoxyphenol hydroxylase-like FAD-dependent oxidoreductase